MSRLERKHMDHESPEWVRAEADYFVTACVAQRNVNHFCTETLGPKILESIRYRNQRLIWFCHMVVLMPDHVHLLVSFPDVPSFAPIIGDWKRWLTTRYSICWQENFFDHRIRKDESFGEKAEYILQNPVRAGLVAHAEEWPYTWIASR
jgi:putative transposase